MEELRRLRLDSSKAQESSANVAAAAVRNKREQEMEELRKLKAAENEEMRTKLGRVVGTLTTMDEFRSNLNKAKDLDRQGKAQAAAGLRSFNGTTNITKSQADRAREDHIKAQRQASASLRDYRDTSFKISKSSAEADRTKEQDNTVERAAATEVPPAAPAETETKIERASRTDQVEVDDDIADRTGKLSVTNGVEEPVKKEAEKPKSPPKEETSKPLPPPETQQKPAPSADGVVEVVHSPQFSIRAPTYTKFDIKFSFGLIVRSSHIDGFDNENLRENETLRKCMGGTAIILREQMPSPPDAVKMSETETSTFKVKYPISYYDPRLKPNVISIEEDVKEGKVAGKGNKRTLVKASFPVFMRDESTSNLSSRYLKETKSTVFKALRAAVSGGSFLR